MKAIRLHGAEDARLDEIPEPQVGPGQVKIRVERTGICGSDLALFQHMPVPLEHVHPLLPEAGPHVLGHEFAGTVTEVGEGVSGVAEGALVAVRPNVWDGTCAACLRGEPNLCASFGFIGINGGGGGYSEYVVVDADHVHEVHDGRMSSRQAFRCDEREHRPDRRCGTDRARPPAVRACARGAARPRQRDQ